jgi:hypothetical protein
MAALRRVKKRLRGAKEEFDKIRKQNIQQIGSYPSQYAVRRVKENCWLQNSRDKGNIAMR